MSNQEKRDLQAQLNNVNPDLSAVSEDSPSETSDLPQVVTESYGTGVKDLQGYTGRRSMDNELAGYLEDSPEFSINGTDSDDEYTETNPSLTGGDIDAFWDYAGTVGDEAVGGTAPTPDQDVTEEIEAAVGLSMDDRAFLRTNDILEQRDDRRWELDPMSSEDYQERRS